MLDKNLKMKIRIVIDVIFFIAACIFIYMFYYNRDRFTLIITAVAIIRFPIVDFIKFIKNRRNLH
jgi:magnesium-transporting ATPase (P-type)